MKISNALMVCAAMLACWSIPRSAQAEIKTAELDYKQGATVLQGFVAWDDAVKGKRPGVLVVHEWWGHNEHAREQARRLAKAGYVGFALDMYGKGKVAAHPNDAKTFMTEATADFKVEKARFDAALAQLKKRPEVNPKQIAAIGYCFGGAVVLDMVRVGEPLTAVATFHGALATKQPAKKGIKPRILVMTGADDPMVPKEQVDAFKSEMTAAGARYEVIEYPGAKHAFTNPEADKHGMPGIAYNAKADQESWASLLTFLNDVWPPKPGMGTLQAAAPAPAAQPGPKAPAQAAPKAQPAQAAPKAAPAKPAP
ncbi:MAG TPA: dienelactone hydrolase family protein [Polyangiales bacterium]|nr:dienelactone hydrolase family protein [Polyangiales bacterium]